MTPCNRIRKEILLRATKDNPELNFGDLDTDEQVSLAYGKLIDEDIHWDYECDFRGGSG